MGNSDQKVIPLNQGFGFVFIKRSSLRLATVVGLCHNDRMVIDEEWLGIVDFITILEMVVAGRFGTNDKVAVGKLSCFGIKKKTYLLHIQIHDYEEVVEEITLSTLECRQLASKLNKLLHGADKYEIGTHYGQYN